MLEVVTVLRIKGRLFSKAAFARISGAFGHIRPCNPMGATPKGASYSIPKSLVLRLTSIASLRYSGTNSTARRSDVFFRRLSSSLQPPSKYSKANLGILVFAFTRKSLTEGYFGLNSDNII